MPTRLKLILPIAAVTLVSCMNDRIASPEVARVGGSTNKIISDAVHSGGKPHFYFLPPMVSNPTVSGTFDAALEPSVVICVWASGSCGSTIATYTMTSGPGGETVRLTTDEHYQANWHTDQFDLDPTTTYRIRVLVGDVELGFADVDVVNSGKELKNVNTNDYIPLLDGRTLPIKFRIEQGFLARIVVVPLTAEIGTNDEQQYVAELTDLHGATLSGFGITWASSDEDVATVDQYGLASAVGDGETLISATAAGVTGTATLVVQGGVVTSAAGYFHSCGLTTTGAAYCWGWNDYAQLGNGTFGNRNSPVPVAGGHTFVSLASGYLHSCALKADGAAWCWGYGGNGALGNSSGASSSVPVQVSGGHSFRSLSAGYYNTCGLTTAGQALCWGEGFYGAIGNGSFTTRLSPTAVSGGHVFESLDVGGAHVCGVTTAQQLLCWGYNWQGQLGMGAFHHTGNPGLATPTAVIGGHTFTDVSATAHNTCAIDESGAVYCWGYNSVGGVGNGVSGSDVHTPTPIVGGQSFTELFPGLSYHTCGRVSSGTVHCWGYNGFGQLGIGSTSVFSTPIALAGTDSWATISTGLYHTCGITTTGVGKCWGYNAFGQLGTGNFAQSAVPALVQGGLTFAIP